LGGDLEDDDRRDRHPLIERVEELSDLHADGFDRGRDRGLTVGWLRTRPPREPARDLASDPMRTALLNEVRPLPDVHRGKVSDVLLAPGDVLRREERAGRGIQHQLRNARSLEPFAILARGFPDIAWLAADRRLSREP